MQLLERNSLGGVVNPDYESRIEITEEDEKEHKSDFMRDVKLFILEYKRRAEICTDEVQKASPLKAKSKKPF